MLVLSPVSRAESLTDLQDQKGLVGPSHRKQLKEAGLGDVVMEHLLSPV